ACSSSLAGRDAHALDLLAQAIAAGFGDPNQIMADPDLAGLHANPRWGPLMAESAKVFERRNRMWNSPALATPWRPALGEDERVAGLSKLWSEAKFNFANFDLVPELDWDATYLEFLPRVRKAQSAVAYYAELQAFVARLHD